MNKKDNCRVQFINAKEKKIEIVNASELGELQKLVEGYLEVVYRTGNYILYVNEEGLLKENLNYGFALSDGTSELKIIGNGCFCKVKFDEKKEGLVSCDNDKRFSAETIRWLDTSEIEEMKKNRKDPTILFGKAAEDYLKGLGL